MPKTADQIAEELVLHAAKILNVVAILRGVQAEKVEIRRSQLSPKGKKS